MLAEADEEGTITKAYGFSPHTQDTEEELWSTDPVWQADIEGGSLTSAQTRYHYITTDHLGTPILATNKSGGKSWRGYSQAFGQTAIEGGSTTSINLRFAGQYFDRETGLHQNWFRDYSPATGRYIQADPLGIFGGLNTYGYAYNDPLGYIDPTGELVFMPIIVGAITGYVIDYTTQWARKELFCGCNDFGELRNVMFTAANMVASAGVGGMSDFVKNLVAVSRRVLRLAIKRLF